MGAWFELISQIIDFAVKGFYAYLATEAGQKEWADIEAAFEVVINNERGEGGIGYRVDNTDDASGSAVAAAAARGAEVSGAGKRYS